LPACPADLTFKHRELMPQGQDFGAQPGVGPAPDDQDFEQQADHEVEHERKSCSGRRVPTCSPPRVANAL